MLSDCCLSVNLVYCGQTVGWIKMKLGMQIGLLCPGHSVLDGDPAPQKKGHSPPPFLAHVYCGQTAVCIRIPLGTEVGLSPGDVLDADPAPSTFGPCLLWPNGPHLSNCWAHCLFTVGSYYLQQNIFLFLFMKLSNRNSRCQQCVYNFRPNLGLYVWETVKARGANCNFQGILNYSYSIYLQNFKGLW